MAKAPPPPDDGSGRAYHTSRNGFLIGSLAPQEGRCNAMLNRKRAEAGAEHPSYCGSLPTKDRPRCWRHGSGSRRKEDAGEALDPRVSALMSGRARPDTIVQSSSVLAALMGGAQGEKLAQIRDAGANWFDLELYMQDAIRGLTQTAQHHDRIVTIADEFAEQVSAGGMLDASSAIVLADLRQRAVQAHQSMGFWNALCVKIFEAREGVREKAGRIPLIQVQALLVIMVAHVDRLVKDTSVDRQDIPKRLEEFLNTIGAATALQNNEPD